MHDPLKNIALVVSSQTRYLYIEIARRVKERHGGTLHLYCKSPEEVDYYRGFDKDSLFDSIVNMRVLYPALRETPPPEDELYAKARAYERRIGTTYNTLAVADRHLGRGYALGGFYHPRSHYSEDAGYDNLVHAYNTQFDFWDSEFRGKEITLLLNGTKEATVIARDLGIPVRSLFRSRHESYHYWTPNEYRDHPTLAAAYAAVGEPSRPQVELTETYTDERQRRKRLMRNSRLSTVLRETAYTLLRHVYWKLKGYEKARGYLVGDVIKLHWRRRRAMRRMMDDSMTRLSDLSDREFVFFPLHTEPELAFGLISPEFFFQLAAISALSRDLPAGVTLAVKESITGVGRRPDNFYAQILEHKNVVMLHLLDHGHEVVRKAKAVATISGTAGFEAAVQGVPVISFGQHNNYGILPHVHVVSDFGRLPDAVNAALDDSDDVARRQRDGARFMDAIVSSSFDLGGYDYFNVNDFSEQAIENAYAALVASFGIEAIDAD